jgi:hypothetical protein
MDDSFFISVEENQTADVTLKTFCGLYEKHEAINDNAWIPVSSNHLPKSRKSARYENLLTNQLIKTSPIHTFNYHRGSNQQP